MSATKELRIKANAMGYRFIKILPVAAGSGKIEVYDNENNKLIGVYDLTKRNFI